jgi:hypothetical protein
LDSLDRSLGLETGFLNEVFVLIPQSLRQIPEYCPYYYYYSIVIRVIDSMVNKLQIKDIKWFAQAGY